MTANQNDQGGKMFVHFWEPTPSYLFEHHSTGLKFMCVEREPGNDPEKWERWDCYTYPVKADDAQVRKEAAAAGMEPSKYVDYLMETARELANKHRIKMGKRWG